MAPILDFIVNFLLVNSKIYKIMSHKIFQTQKGVNSTLPKTYPYMLTNYNFSFHQIKNSPNLQNVISAFLCYPIIFSTKQNLHHHEEKRGERSKVLSQRKKKHGKRLLANIARKPKMMALNTVEVTLPESLRRKAVTAALEERINISPCNYK